MNRHLVAFGLYFCFKRWESVYKAETQRIGVLRGDYRGTETLWPLGILRCMNSGTDTETRTFLDHIRYLGNYLRPHKRVLAVSLCLSIVSTALGMIQPYFAKILIDGVFIAGKPDLLWPLLAALILLLVVGFGIRVTNSYVYTRYSAGLLFKMREDLFDHLHRIPLRILSRRKIGDLHSRIASDMADIQTLATETIPNWLFDFLTCTITVVILLWLQWQMALMSLCFLPAGVWAIRYLRPRLERLARNIAEGNADISHFLFESLGGTLLVRAFDAERLESEKLCEKQSHILRYLLNYQALGAIAGSVPIAFVIVNSLVVFGYGGFLVLKGTLTLGTLMAFAIYQGRVLSPLQGMMNGVLALQKTKVSLSRVREILDLEPDCLEYGASIIQDRDLRGEIVFERVCFAYEEEKPVLENLSFRIPAGQTTALVGPSGVGKTTICNLAMRLFDPDSGMVTLDGISLKDLRKDWLRKQIALISQDTFLFHTSILENIRFAKPDVTQEEIIDAARAACIDEFIRTLPRGYDTEVGDRGIRLSSGQRQRISIARSILIRPKILIMDEATAFLDHAVEERLKETLRELMKDRTILVISHRLSAIEGADNLVVVSEEGTTYEGPFPGFLPGEKESYLA